MRSASWCLPVLFVLSCGTNAGSGASDGGVPDGPPVECEHGLELVEGECVDIDECAVDNGGCGDAAVWLCENRNAASPRCRVDCRADYPALAQGVALFDSGGGLPSSIIVHGDNACPLVVDESGATFVAYARHGDGRLLHFGHEGPVAAPIGDGVTLLVNAVRWAGQGDTPVVGVESGSGADGARDVLAGLGFDARLIASGERTGIDVVITTSYFDRTDGEYQELRDFVEGGGGLIQAGLAWWWSYTHDNVALEYPGNRLLNELGLTVTEDIVMAGTDVVPTDAPSDLLHAGRALEAVIGHLIGDAPLADVDQPIAARTVRRAVQLLPVAFDLYWDRVRALVPRIDPVVPTVDDPVVVDVEFFDALIVTIHTKLAAELPAPEVVAVASDWPGEVDAAAPRVSRTVSVEASYVGMNANYVYANAGEPLWRGTGLYAPPGEVVTVTIPAAWAGQGLSVGIGAYTDTLWHLADWMRYPAVSRNYELADEITVVASGFGGPIYVRVPAGLDLGAGDVTIDGAVEYPRYVHGVTTPTLWQAMVAAPGAPMVEFESDRFVLTIHRSELPVIADPAPLMDFWNAVLDADADLAAIDHNRVRAERFAVDRQISAGWMHSGYPIMGYDYGATLADAAIMTTLGDWGAFHELGHDHQWGPAVLSGTTEATCNLWSVYASEQVVGLARDLAHPALQPAARTARIEAYVAGGRNFWIDWNVWTALETYLQLQESFGWPLIIDAHARYLSMPVQPVDDNERVDTWVVLTCEEAAQDLTAFYDKWGFPMSAATYTACAAFPAWTNHPMVPY